MQTFTCLLSQEDAQAQVHTSVQELPMDFLGNEGMLVQVAYSSLNYKDALSAHGHRGITKRFPHIPGIDAAAWVLEDPSRKFVPGQAVILTGFDMGMNAHGGLSTYLRVPSSWALPLPEGMSLEMAMQWGTAGLTAAMALDQLLLNGLSSDPVLVTGASGGLGVVAIKLLKKLGYQVHALSHSPEKRAFILSAGADEVLDYTQFLADQDRALYAPIYAGAIDTLGGTALVKVIKSLKAGGSVAACGMAASTDLPLQIYPFILRGSKLLGIYSADAPLEYKAKLWSKIAGPWALDLSQVGSCISLEQAPAQLSAMLKGQSLGRRWVKITT